MNTNTNKSNIAIALLIFIAVFGITNIPNNYAAIGAESIFWFSLLVIYFIPLALIIAELASFDPNTNSGIAKWVELGTTKKIAFVCGWAYFIENIFYLPMLASRVPVFLSWIFVPYNSLSEIVATQGNVPGMINATSNKTLFLTLAFIVMIIAIVMSLYFEKIFEKIGKVVGTISLITAFSFIVMTIASVVILKHNPAYPLTFENLKPTASPNTISTLVWIIFAIGGVETIGSVVKDIDRPSQRLPKIVLIGSILVILSYVIGIIGLTFVLRPDQLSKEVLENAIPIMFAQAGNAIGLSSQAGVIFLKAIMASQVLITISALVLWFVTTINVLFTESDTEVFPDFLNKRTKDGIPVNATVFTAVLILIFLLFSASSSASNVYTMLYSMSTVSMVIPFILLLVSFINFKKKGMEGKYVFIKNRTLSMVVGWFLLAITAFAFVFGVIDLGVFPSGTPLEMWESFKILGGGLLFFMLIGMIIYYWKSNKKRAIVYSVLTALTGILIFIPFG